MALNGLICAEVPLRNCSLTYSLTSLGTLNFTLAKMAICRTVLRITSALISCHNDNTALQQCPNNKPTDQP